jgi:hypothetical protein
VLVHGINQQGKSEIAIRDEWLKSLTAASEPGRFTSVSVLAPFYGDVLAELTNARGTDWTVAQGIDAQDDEERAFIARGLSEIGAAAELTDEEIVAEQGSAVVKQGLPHDRRFIAIVSLLERLSPFKGQLALRLLKQAYAYIKRPHITEAIDSIVKPALMEGPAVIIAHSLGTVITFRCLREMHGASVPLYVTVGSPLGVRAVQAALRKPRHRPMGVQRWLNCIDPSDFITLGRGLTEENFGSGVENKVDIRNPDDAHSISGYLSDKYVCHAVMEVMS